MRIQSLLYLALAMVLVANRAPAAAQEPGDFRVPPYLQNPRPEGMTVVWFSENEEPGRLSYVDPSGVEEAIDSVPILAETLTYLSQESGFFGGQPPPPPYRHRVEITSLAPGTRYAYAVEQGASRFASSFATAPGPDSRVRLIVFGDSETEPESTGARRRWADPTGDPNRLYLLEYLYDFAQTESTPCRFEQNRTNIPGDRGD